MAVKDHLPNYIHGVIKFQKAVIFLTVSVENGKKLTEIWGIDNLWKLSYSENGERIPK